MIAIVTGATGFIGRHLVDALAAAGDEVRCLTRGKPRTDGRANVSFHQANYERSDLGLSDEVVNGVQAVYHLSGATRAVGAASFREANVAVTERLLDRIAGQPARFVFVSSQAAAGPARDAAHAREESDPEAPIEDYGRSKLGAERSVRARTDIEATIVRPVAVYGPGDRDFLSIFSMVKRGLAVYPGIRNSSINVIYVDDLVAGMIAAAKSTTAAGKTYFLGDDAAHSWREVYRVIADVIGQARPVELNIPHGLITIAGALGDVVGSISGRPLLVNSSKAMLAAPRYWLCSSERASEDFGFRASTPLGEGMRATYDWYLRNRWL